MASSLVDEIKRRLEGSPDNAGLLWRLARALTHLSMHKQRMDDADGERELLQQGNQFCVGGSDNERVSPSQLLRLLVKPWTLMTLPGRSISGTPLPLAPCPSSRAHRPKYKRGLSTRYTCHTPTHLTQSHKAHPPQEHIDKAISLNPNYPTLHYLCGRWCYEVSGLSWLEKKAAAALYATPPDATYDESLQCFMTAEELSPGKWKGNMLMIAKVAAVVIATPAQG